MKDKLKAFHNHRLHQGSSLSPYLFVLAMDELTGHIQNDISWCMLFADDILLIDEMHEGVNAKLNFWWEVLDAKSLSRSKTSILTISLMGMGVQMR